MFRFPSVEAIFTGSRMKRKVYLELYIPSSLKGLRLGVFGLVIQHLNYCRRHSSLLKHFKYSSGGIGHSLLACSSGSIPRLSLVCHSLYGGVLLRRCSLSENEFVKFRSRTYRCRTFTKDLPFVVWLLPDECFFLNKGIIIYGLAVTLCIMMAAFSVSVRLCCTGVSSCLIGSM